MRGHRAAAAAVLVAALSACTGGGSEGGAGDLTTSPTVSGPSATASDLPAPAPTSSASATPTPAPSKAAAPSNVLFPLTPGFQSVRQGNVTKGSRRLSHRLVFTVTDVVKKVDGSTAVVAIDQDFDGGELAEQSLEIFAVDKDGTVRYLGSYTETYEGGQFVNSTDAWLAGVRGGRGGVIMPAAPRTGTPTYTQAYVPGEGSARAKVVKTGERKCVKFRCFTDVVVTEEDGSELKYYAPGVGGILTVPLSGNPQETEELINVTQLSPKGLVELSTEVLKLDQHARRVSRDVYGTSSPAIRA